MNKIKDFFKYLVFICSVAVIIAVNDQCATVGRPTGGDKDTIPPVMVFADPEINTVNFNEKRIDIGFNEYVKLNNIDKELIISPPVKKKPKIWIKGKGFYFEVNRDEFIDSTTYTFNFGKSIVDVNEGNPYQNFTYVFSTGPVIDSFGISGVIVSAFDLRPSKEPYSIMLYKNIADSMPYKERPIYATRSLPDGTYNLEHIKAGTYRLFAVKEQSQNFIYDSKNEDIAFSDSLITLKPELFENLLKDTLVSDSTQIDSIAIASATDENTYKIYGLHHNLFSFHENKPDTSQFMDNWKLLYNKLIYISFNQPVTDSFSFALIDSTIQNNWNVQEFSYSRDSLNIWITDTSVLALDTISLAVTYLKSDSLNKRVLNTDTLLFLKRRMAVETKRRKRNDEEDEDTTPERIYLNFNTNIKNGQTIQMYDHIIISTTTPLLLVDTSRIKFTELIDTLEYRREYLIQRDSVKLNKYHFYFDIKEGSKFKISFYDSAFTDIYNISNDTVYLNFSTKRLDQYGKLSVDMIGVNGNIIVQLIDGKENVVDSKIINHDQVIVFDYLTPAEYGMKVIYDENKNMKWDTGDYLKKRLPEKVGYYSKKIKIRENWDHAESWDLSNEN